MHISLSYIREQNRQMPKNPIPIYNHIGFMGAGCVTEALEVYNKQTTLNDRGMRIFVISIKNYSKVKFLAILFIFRQFYAN